MASVIFGSTLNMLTAATPSSGGYVVAYDLDGILKQKDEFGIITEIGGGPTAGVGGTPSLSDVMGIDNNSNTYSLIMGTSTSLLSANGGGQIDLDYSGTNSILISTDNASQGEHGVLMENGYYALYANGYSQALLLDDGSENVVLYNTIGDLQIGVNTGASPIDSVDELKISNNGSSTASTGNNDKQGIFIGTRNSVMSPGVVNSVIIGGVTILGTQSNTVYLGNSVNINNSYTLPSVDGSSGQVLTTDGSGNINFMPIGGSNLEQVLSIGNDSGVYDIIMGTQTLIKSSNGGGQIELDSLGVSSSVYISTDNGSLLTSNIQLDDSNINIQSDNIDILSGVDLIINSSGTLGISGTTVSVISGNSQGFVYGFDYSSTFVNNSLVSKLYVDNGTASIWNEINNINNDYITEVIGGVGLTGGGTAGVVTLDVNLETNSGLTFSGDDITLELNSNSLEVDSNNQIRLKDTVVGNRTFADSVIISGDLTVSGTATYVNTEELYVADNIITLNATYSTGTPFLDSGIHVLRGSSQSSSIIWDETLEYWGVGLSGSESTIITEAGSGLIKTNNELSVDFGTVSSITYVDAGTASLWAAIESSNELSEVLSNGNITDGNNITLSGSDVLQTGTTTSGSQILLDYSGGGKDILISNDGGNEGEAGIYISNENGFYGTTLYQDGYNANMILEKTSGWVGPTGGGSGYNFTVTFNSQSSPGNNIIPFKASDLSSQIFNGTKGTNIDKYGFVSFGFVDSDVQFFGGGTGAGSIHSNQTYFVEGVENSVSIGTSQSRVKTNNTLYINQLGHTEDATKESLIQFTTLTDSRTLIIPDASGTFSLLSDLDTATNSLWSAIDSINNDYITEVIGGQGLTGGGTAGVVTLDANTSNGLSISNDNIVLGGTLSQNTIIDGQGYDITLSADYMFLTSSVFDIESDFISFDSGTGSTQILSGGDTTLSSTNLDLLATNGVYVVGSSFSVNAVEIDPTSASTGQALVFDGVKFSPSTLSGDIAGITAGAGLTGGGSSGYVTLDAQVNNGLSITSDYIGLGGTLSNNTIITMGSNTLTFSGNQTTLRGLNTDSNSYTLWTENSSGSKLTSIDNTGRVVTGMADTASTRNLMGSGHFTVKSSTNNGLVLTNASLDGVTPNTTSDNVQFSYQTRDSAGALATTSTIWVRNRNVTAGSVYGVMVINAAIQVENPDNISGRTLVSTRDRHTFGGASGVLHVENRDDSAIVTTLLVDSFTQDTQSSFAVRSGSLGTTANTFNWRLRNNHEFTHNEGQLATGDFILRGLTDVSLFRSDASTDRIGIGTASPSTKLHVFGDFRLEDGTEANGYILTSDANGRATWVAPPIQTIKVSDIRNFTASVVETITHTLNTEDLIIQTYDSTGVQIIPDTIQITGTSSVDITLSQTLSNVKTIIIG